MTNHPICAILYLGDVEMIDIAGERRKILDGTYPSRVIAGRQNKHIHGTFEFMQKRDSMGSEPAKLKDGIDVQALVDKYKGSGRIYFKPDKNLYPREDIKADGMIGETWVKSLGKYVDTSVFTIMYSKTGVHIVPVNERGRR